MPGSTPGRRGKVARLLERYDIEAFGDQLAADWTAPPGERTGLRGLAETLNVRLLAESLRAAGRSVSQDEAEATYRRLTGDEVSSGVRTQTVRSLRHDGVDVEDLLDDFVSRQAVHTYLRKSRGLSNPERASEDAGASARSVIGRLRERTRRVTSDRIGRLRDGGDLRLGPFRVVVDVRVYCESCQEQYDVDELLDAGRCACDG